MSDDELFEKKNFNLKNFRIDILNTHIQTIKIETINGVETYVENGNIMTITDFSFLIIEHAHSIKSGKLEEYKSQKLKFENNPSKKVARKTPSCQENMVDRSLVLLHRKINKNAVRKKVCPLTKLKDRLKKKNCIVPNADINVKYDEIVKAETLEQISTLIKREKKINLNVILAYTMLCTQKNHAKIKNTSVFKEYDSHMKKNECGKQSRTCIRNETPLSKSILKNTTLLPKSKEGVKNVDSYILYSVWYMQKLLNHRSNGNSL